MTEPTTYTLSMVRDIEQRAYERGLAEARADGDEFIWQKGYDKGRADALRKAAERVRALLPHEGSFYIHASAGSCIRGCHEHTRAAVLAILDPEAAP